MKSRIFSSRSIFLFIFFIVSILLLIFTIITNQERKITRSHAVEQKTPLYTEKQVSNVTCTIETLHADDFERKRSSNELFFINDHTREKSKLIITDNLDALFLSGTKVTIKKATERTLLQSQSSLPTLSISPSPQLPSSKTILAGGGDIQVTFTPPLDVLGKQKILILLGYEQGVDPTTLPDPTVILDKVNQEVIPFYTKNSYDKLSLSADIIPTWHEMEEIDPELDKFYEHIQSIAQKVADSGSSQKLAESKSLMYVLVTNNSKNWGGRGTLGKTYLEVTNVNQVISLNVAQSIVVHRSKFLQKRLHNISGQDYSDNTSLSVFSDIFAHEFGHNLGARHATKAWCAEPFNENRIGDRYIKKIDKGNEVKEVKVFENETCYSFSEYGNDFDVMGNGVYGLYFNPFLKKHFNWIDSPDSIKTVSVDKEQNNIDEEYILHTPFDGGVKWVVVDGYLLDYYIEYREKDQNDKGILIHTHEELSSYADHLERSLVLIQEQAIAQDVFSLTQQYPLFNDYVYNLQIELKEINPITHTAKIIIRSNKPDPADVNEDRVINSTDLDLVYQKFNEQGSDLPEDVNQDGAVDILDVTMVAQKMQDKKTFPPLPDRYFWGDSPSLGLTYSFYPKEGTGPYLGIFKSTNSINNVFSIVETYNIRWNMNNQWVSVFTDTAVTSSHLIKSALQNAIQRLIEIRDTSDAIVYVTDGPQRASLDDQTKKIYLNQLIQSLSTFSDVL